MKDEVLLNFRRIQHWGTFVTDRGHRLERVEVFHRDNTIDTKRSRYYIDGKRVARSQYKKVEAEADASGPAVCLLG